MAFPVNYSKDFTRRVAALGRADKKLATIARSAMTEAALSGAISLPRTNHGESRLPNIEKFDLPGAYRLVVQVVDTKKQARVFLFIGTHDDAEQWLDLHRDYRWVRRETDGVLDFVQVAVPEPRTVVSVQLPETPPPDSLLEKPLLRFLGADDWAQLRVPAPVRDYAVGVTHDDWNQDATAIADHIASLGGERVTFLLIDLFHHAADGQPEKVRTRIALEGGTATVLELPQVASELATQLHAESFLTFDDAGLLDELFEKGGTWADWMVFLHPMQKEIATREFEGPARLRGVSGSGKTCVVVQRARTLARRYKAPILVVALTESMRKLLDNLLNVLCGAERSLITTRTLNALANDIAYGLDPDGARRMSSLSKDQQRTAGDRSVAHVVGHPDFKATLFAGWNRDALDRFLRDEFEYVRSRLTPHAYDRYLDTTAFKRVGRTVPLDVPARRVALAGVRFWDAEMSRVNALDPLGSIHRALALIEHKGQSGVRWRCILADEVQDLAELEVLLLARLQDQHGQPMATVPDGLFFAGDGAQSIYKRGFSFRSVGLDIAKRSFVMKKNYRNSYEILRAAFPLVRDYEFSDHDEDTMGKPLSPDLASRHSERPRLCRYRSIQDEVLATVDFVAALVAYGQDPGQICVISGSPQMRDRIDEGLQQRGVQTAELRDDVDVLSDNVKYSTIESAKGHEFEHVFLVGVVDGVVPRHDTTEADLPREASKLYVAMTRARSFLTISYNLEGAAASPFLASIQDECDEYKFENKRLVPLQ